MGRHANRRGGLLQGILHAQPVLGLAEDDNDRGLFIGQPDGLIKQLEIKLHLFNELRLELPNLRPRIMLIQRRMCHRDSAKDAI